MKKIEAKVAGHCESDLQSHTFTHSYSINLSQSGDIFLDVNPEEVLAISRQDNNLILQFADGEQLTLIGFFSFEEICHLYFQGDNFEEQSYFVAIPESSPQGELAWTSSISPNNEDACTPATAAADGNSGLLLGALALGGVAAVAGGGGSSGSDPDPGNGGNGGDDATPPDAPVVNPSNGDGVSGTAEPGSTITLKVGDDVVGQGPTDGNGNWSIDVEPDLDHGEEVAVSATDDAGNESSETVIVVDAKAPVVTVDPLLTSDVTPELNGTVDEPSATVVVTIGGIDYVATNNGDGSWTLPDNTVAALPEGLVSVSVSATDDAGNTGTANRQIEIDLTAPGAPTINPTNGMLITGTAEPGTEVTLSFDGEEEAAVTVGPGGLWSYDPAQDLQDGTVITAVATDDAGNVSDPDTEIVDVGFEDATPPPPPDFNPTNGTEVSGNAEPGSTVELTVAGEVVGTTTAGSDGSWTVDLEPDLDDGDIIEGTATDIAGNESDPSSVTVDAIAPAITFENINTNDSTPELSGTVDDPTASVIVTVNGVNYMAINNGDGTWTLPDDTIATLPAGDTVATATATDSAGNTGSDVGTISVDLSGLTVTIDPLTTNDPTPELTGTVDDPAASVVVTINGMDYAANNNGDGTWTLADNTINALLEGDTSALVSAATDSDEDTDTSTITVDLTAPMLTINDLTSNDATPELTGTVDDPAAAVVVTIGGADYNAVNNGDGTWTLADNVIVSLPEGANNATATATDTAGNSATDNGTITIDLTGLTVTIDPLVTNDATPELTGTVDDPAASVVVTVNGMDYAATNNGDGTWTLANNAVAPLSEGNTLATVTAFDSGGNEDNDVATITVDITAPTATVAITAITEDTGMAGDFITSDNTLIVSGTLTGSLLADEALQISIDGGNNWINVPVVAGAWSYVDDRILEDADYTYDVRVVDEAGNVGATDSQNIIVDTVSEATVTINNPVVAPNDPSPEITGTSNNVAGNIEVTIGGTTVEVTPDGVGNWSIEWPQPLVAGGYTVSAIGLDNVGNPASDSNSFTIAFSQPVAPPTDLIFDVPVAEGAVLDAIETLDGLLTFLGLDALDVTDTVDALIDRLDTLSEIPLLGDAVDAVVEALRSTFEESDIEGVALGAATVELFIRQDDFLQSSTAASATVNPDGSFSIPLEDFLDLLDSASGLLLTNQGVDVGLRATDSNGNVSEMQYVHFGEAGLLLDDPIAELGNTLGLVFGVETPLAVYDTAFIGTNSEDVFVGDAGADVMTGYEEAFDSGTDDGDDLLIGNGGADEIYGGTGSDIVSVADGNFVYVDGGPGDDVLLLAGAGIDLDFAGSALLQNAVDNIEEIDIGGSGSNSINLNELAIGAITDDDNILRIDGDSDDAATLQGAVQTGSQSLNGNDYVVYELGSATLWVNDDVPVVVT